jgi:hypothetical protein
MAHDDEFGSRVAAVESGVAAAQADASAARELAAGASADVAEVRAALNAHFRVLNALRDTQREGFARMDLRFAAIDQRFAVVDESFAMVERQFAVVNTGVAQITAMLTTLTDTDSGQAGQN